MFLNVDENILNTKDHTYTYRRQMRDVDVGISSYIRQKVGNLLFYFSRLA